MIIQILYLYIIDWQGVIPLAKFFNLDALLEKSGCSATRYSSIITDYIFGGGHYNCSSSFPSFIFLLLFFCINYGTINFHYFTFS